MMQKVLAATAKQPKQKFKTGKFRAKVMEFYGATEVRDGVDKVHCPLAGWCMAEEVRCAHVVPRILSSEELSHLDGGGELPLHDPRNGMLVRFVSLVGI